MKELLSAIAKGEWDKTVLIKEIMQACERRIEMMNEDGIEIEA